MQLLLISIFIILAILLVYYAIKNREGMVSAKKLPSPNIVLLGDYRFHQPKIGQYPSIKEIIKNKYPLANVRVLTNDCPMIDNINSFINNIPSNLNKPNTTIFVSIGENDIYKNLLNCYSNKEVKGSESKLLACNKTTSIFNEWGKEISELIDKFNKCKIVILGSYLPKLGSNIPVCKHKVTIDKNIDEDLDYWNVNVSEYAKNKNISFLPSDKIIGENSYEKDGITIKKQALKKLINMILSEIKSS